MLPIAPPSSGPIVLDSMKYTPPPCTAPFVAMAQIDRTVVNIDIFSWEAASSERFLQTCRHQDCVGNGELKNCLEDPGIAN